MGKQELTKRELKKHIMEDLLVSIDKGNYGMLSRAKVKIKGNLVYQDDTPVYRIERRYGKHKREGMYKELAPKLVEV